MTVTFPSRAEALVLLKEFTTKESLINHGLSVESVMRRMARKYGQNEETWGIVGLVHDLDWEKFPDQHCVKTKEILEERNWPPEYVRAIVSHAWGICTEVEPITDMEKVLYTIDELTGFVTACALVRPSRSVCDLEVKSVKKKWKQKDFAANVDRSVVERGAALLDEDLDYLIQEVITALREVADEIGLEPK